MKHPLFQLHPECSPGLQSPFVVPHLYGRPGHQEGGTNFLFLHQPAVARQQDLSKYGFRCTCKACTGDTSEIDKFRATKSEALDKLFAYQQRFLRNPLVTEKALEPVYRFKAAAIKAGGHTWNVDKIILETLEMINERKGDGKEVLRLREEKVRLLNAYREGSYLNFPHLFLLHV